MATTPTFVQIYLDGQAYMVEDPMAQGMAQGALSQLSAMGQSVKANTTNIEKNTAQITANTDNIAKVNTRVDNLTAQEESHYNSLLTQVSKLNLDVPQLQYDVTELTGRVDTMEGDTIPTLSGRVTTAESAIEGLSNRADITTEWLKARLYGAPLLSLSDVYSAGKTLQDAVDIVNSDNNSYSGICVDGKFNVNTFVSSSKAILLVGVGAAQLVFSHDLSNSMAAPSISCYNISFNFAGLTKEGGSALLLTSELGALTPVPPAWFVGCSFVLGGGKVTRMINNTYSSVGVHVDRCSFNGNSNNPGAYIAIGGTAKTVTNSTFYSVNAIESLLSAGTVSGCSFLACDRAVTLISHMEATISNCRFTSATSPQIVNTMSSIPSPALMVSGCNFMGGGFMVNFACKGLRAHFTGCNFQNTSADSIKIQMDYTLQLSVPNRVTYTGCTFYQYSPPDDAPVAGNINLTS